MLEGKFGAAKWAMIPARSRQRIIHDEWEHMIKLEFDGREHIWEIREPWECVDLTSLRAGAEWPTILLNAVDVGRVFDPTINKILAMVDDQVAEVRAKKWKDPKVRASLVLNCFRALIRYLVITSASSWPEGLADPSISSPHSRNISTAALRFYSLVAQTRMAKLLAAGLKRRNVADAVQWVDGNLPRSCYPRCHPDGASRFLGASSSASRSVQLWSRDDRRLVRKETYPEGQVLV